jgi:hypothetical protein
MTEEADNTPRLDKETVKRIQQIVGTLLYFARAVDSTTRTTQCHCFRTKQSN